MLIAGVRYFRDGPSNSHLCIVDDLSDEVKNLLRSDLSKVCHGQAKAVSGTANYSYKRTLKHFLLRYHAKTAKTKLGMIGELLCNILLFVHEKQLRAASPLFNMEEASIKKGFDLLVSDVNDNSLWITEVKSGELGKAQKHDKIRSLIDKAKDDLIFRIGSDNSTIWHSAINNVTLALRDSSSEKDVLIERLEQLLDGSDTAANSASDVNAILAPILFEDTINSVDFDVIKSKAMAVKDAKIFSGCAIFAIQKSTLMKVENFLVEEAREP